jgi:presenilin-like A22 family membrane protease
VRVLNSETRSQMIYLLPISAVLMFGLACAFLLSTSSFEPYQITPFSESSSGVLGSFGNAFYFAVLAGVGATILYFLLKRSRLKLISVITGCAITAAAFMLSMVYISAALSGFLIPAEDLLVLVSSVLVTVAVDYAIFGRHRLSGPAVLGIGGALGTFLGFSLPTTSAILVLAALAVYDIYAVYRGPVGRIAQNGIDQLRGLSFSLGNVQIGLGDLTFYSMLSGHMFIYFGLVPCLASMVGILIGCLVSFDVVERKGMFPGLPVPIFLGLATGFAALLLASL